MKRASREGANLPIFIRKYFCWRSRAFKFPVSHPNLSSVVLLSRASPGLRSKE